MCRWVATSVKEVEEPGGMLDSLDQAKEYHILPSNHRWIYVVVQDYLIHLDLAS